MIWKIIFQPKLPTMNIHFSWFSSKLPNNPKIWHLNLIPAVVDFPSLKVFMQFVLHRWDNL